MYNQQYKKIPEYERHIRNEEEYRDAIRNLRKGERFRIEDLMERTDVNFNEEQFTPFDFAYTVNALKNDYNISERPEQYMQMAKDYMHNDSFPERGGNVHILMHNKGQNAIITPMKVITDEVITSVTASGIGIMTADIMNSDVY